MAQPADTTTRTVPAPDFPSGLQWVNTDRPVRIEDLRGRLVILDFWTFCCINCMHVLPKLRRLEQQYPDTLAVVGVHSPKFDHEKSLDNIIAATRRHDIVHPVVNDADFTIWSTYGVRAWPTLAFIDPSGNVVGKHEGEFQYDAMERLIGKLVRAYSQQGLITAAPLPFQQTAAKHLAGTLAFPGKVATGEGGDLLVADSAHHRVLMRRDDTWRAFGGFDNPQGLAYHDGTIYVADVGHHTISSVDVSTGATTVIAGTGEQSLIRSAGGAAVETPLSSPYDIAFRDGNLYICMAGKHQIWKLNLASGWLEPWAGNGSEAIVDAERADAELAQPSGMALDRNNIYFADAETSSVRIAKFGNNGRVVTLVGTGLFDFGDRDAIGKDAELQHPQDVAVGPDCIYVADTYNHKIKRIELSTLQVTTVAGNGEPGLRDGEAQQGQFNSPAGIAYSEDRNLFVADTSNHALRRIDLDSQIVETIEVDAPPLAD